MKTLFNFVSILCILFVAFIIYMFCSVGEKAPETIVDETEELVENVEEYTNDLFEDLEDSANESGKEEKMNDIKDDIIKTKQDIASLGKNIYDFVTNLN